MMQTTTLTSDRNRYCAAWAQMMVDIWIEKANAMGIRAGDLTNSFAQDIYMAANGEVDKITHSFLYYGRFVDMGVGRGVPLEKVAESSRTPKPFNSSTYWRSVQVLTEKMAEIYGEEFQVYVSEIFNIN